jgi:hypothetical protein
MKPFPYLVFYVGSYLYSTRETPKLWVDNGILFEAQEGEAYDTYNDVVWRLSVL